MLSVSLDQVQVVRHSFDSKTFIYCWSILSDGDNMTGDKDSTGNGAGKENEKDIYGTVRADPKLNRLVIILRDVQEQIRKDSTGQFDSGRISGIETAISILDHEWVA